MGGIVVTKFMSNLLGGYLCSRTLVGRRMSRCHCSWEFVH